MEMILRLAAVVVLAVLAGKLASRLKMPAVLGVFIAGMAFGPLALNLLTQEILDHPAYHTLISFLECGMVYSAVFANFLDEAKLECVMEYCTPAVNACFTLIILNLGAPLDYHLILGAGGFTAVYIIARAAGKLGGAALGAQLSHAAPTVKRYLGMVILPHSGVSLVLTGIAISALSGSYSQYGDIVRGTIAAAAVINEAVFMARQGFRLAGEMGQGGTPAPAPAA